VLQGIRLEARPAAVFDWLAGPAAAPAVALAAAAATAGGPHEALAEADADRDARCRRALRAVQVVYKGLDFSNRRSASNSEMRAARRACGVGVRVQDSAGVVGVMSGSCMAPIARLACAFLTTSYCPGDDLPAVEWQPMDAKLED
jgi:hypothetical protein